MPRNTAAVLEYCLGARHPVSLPHALRQTMMLCKLPLKRAAVPLSMSRVTGVPFLLETLRVTDYTWLTPFFVCYTLVCAYWCIPTWQQHRSAVYSATALYSALQRSQQRQP